MDNQKNIAPEMPNEAKLLKAIFEDDSEVNEALNKAAAWRIEHGNTQLTYQNVIDAVEVAQGLIATDINGGWDNGMQDDEKNDLAELMCSLTIARELIADMLGLPTKGRIEKVEVEDGGEH